MPLLVTSCHPVVHFLLPHSCMCILGIYLIDLVDQFAGQVFGLVLIATLSFGGRFLSFSSLF